MTLETLVTLDVLFGEAAAHIVVGCTKRLKEAAAGQRLAACCLMRKWHKDVVFEALGIN